MQLEDGLQSREQYYLNATKVRSVMVFKDEIDAFHDHLNEQNADIQFTWRKQIPWTCSSQEQLQRWLYLTKHFPTYWSCRNEQEPDTCYYSDYTLR